MKFGIQYRFEKKKIIRSNIDLAKYVLRILEAVKQSILSSVGGKAMPELEYRQLYMSKTDVESEGLYKKWVMASDFDEEE